MASLLSLSCSNNFVFSMLCDVYYATESQDKYGQVVKSWVPDASLPCTFYTPPTTVKSDEFRFTDNKFYSMESTLIGRIGPEIKVSAYPLSNLLITSIRTNSCESELLYSEKSVAGYETVPTVFDVRMLQPHVGVFNKIEYYRVVLERSDRQDLPL